jgi:hypothetical protein
MRASVHEPAGPVAQAADVPDAVAGDEHAAAAVQERAVPGVCPGVWTTWTPPGDRQHLAVGEALAHGDLGEARRPAAG